MTRISDEDQKTLMLYVDNAMEIIEEDHELLEFAMKHEEFDCVEDDIENLKACYEANKKGLRPDEKGMELLKLQHEMLRAAAQFGMAAKLMGVLK